MGKRTRFGGHGSPDIMKIDTHQWDGRLINRVKARRNEKEKGVLIKDTVSEFFSLTPDEEKRIRESIRRKYLNEIPPLQNNEAAPLWKDLAKDKERAQQAKEERDLKSS